MTILPPEIEAELKRFRHYFPFRANIFAAFANGGWQYHAKNDNRLMNSLVRKGYKVWKIA